jgi:hypothetical protein
MLAYLDTLIGFATVMLGASLIITMLTQMISALFSHRGANLLWGLETMFKNLPDSPLLNDPNTAAEVAKSVLTHPMISDSIFSLKPRWLADRIRLAKAIDPDELIAILRELSATPAFTSLRTEILALIDARNPEADRRLILLAGSITSEAGKLESRFNATMDRVSARFTTYVRLWTIAFALTLALVTGLNSVTLLNGLYINGAFRQAVTASAPQSAATLRQILTIASFDVTQFRWTAEPWWKQVPGVLLTAGLLSLGAPFWFNMLKQLTGLRPIIANKKDN